MVNLSLSPSIISHFCKNALDWKSAQIPEIDIQSTVFSSDEVCTPDLVFVSILQIIQVGIYGTACNALIFLNEE